MYDKIWRRDAQTSIDPIVTDIVLRLEEHNNVCDALTTLRSDLAIPPSVTLEMAKGFTLYMVKAVMNSRDDRVIELAHTNLWR
jgi:hypothetical protein